MPAIRKPLRITDDDKDPVLLIRVAQTLSPTTTTVGEVTAAGGDLPATALFAG